MTFNLPFIKNKSESGNITRRDYFDNIFNDFLNEFYSLPTTSSTTKNLLPRADISETSSEYCLEVELPGMDAKNVDLKIDNNILTIKGQKEATSENKEKNYYMRERYYGTFQRSITLPSNIKEDDINARFENGILYIKIPKKEQAKTKKIEVK